MEAAADAKPGRGSPPVPPNYVSLRQLQELRLKEKEEQERRRREEEEAAAAAAAKREAEKAAMAAAIKREAALKAEQERRRREEEEAAAKREADKAAMAAAVKREAKGSAGSWEASVGAKERPRGGRAQGQGNQWVAVAHQAPATTLQPMARGQGTSGKRGAAIGGGGGEKGPDDVPGNGPHGGRKPLVRRMRKGKGKAELGEGALASSHGGKPGEVVPPLSNGGKPGEVVPTLSNGGKPENKSESKAKGKGKGPGDQAAESNSRGGPDQPAEAAISSSRNRSRPREVIHAYAPSAESSTGIARTKAEGPSPERGVKPDGMEKPKHPAPTRADAVAGSDSPDGKKAAPAQTPPTSAADGSSKPTSGGDSGKEAKPEGLVEGRRWRPVAEAQAVAELNPRAARCSAGPLSGRRNWSGEQHGRVWVAKTAAAAAGSSAGAGL